MDEKLRGRFREARLAAVTPSKRLFCDRIRFPTSLWTMLGSETRAQHFLKCPQSSQECFQGLHDTDSSDSADDALFPAVGQFQTSFSSSTDRLIFERGIFRLTQRLEVV